MRIITFVFALVCASALAQGTGNFYYDHYSTGQGLSHKTVTDILRTRDGFLWVGTTNGINRFDGYSIRKFHLKDAGNKGSGSNIINDIDENSRGQLFIATNNGVKYFESRTEQFHQIELSGNSGGNFSAVCAADSGTVWASRAGVGIYCLVPESGGGFRADFFTLPAELSKRGLFDVWKLYYNEGNLWVASSLGLFKLNIRTRKLTQVEVGGVLPYCTAMRSGRKDELIVVSNVYGLIHVNMKTLAVQWKYYSEFSTKKKGVGYLQDVALLPSGELYISASPGIFRQDAEGTPIQNETSLVPEQLRIDVSSVLYYDYEGILWVGTDNYGFFGLKNPERNFNTLPLFDSKDYSHSLITSMQVLANKDIVYGGTRGLYYYNSGNEREQSIRKITDNPVSSIQATASGEVYYFTHDSLVQFYPKTKLLRNLLAVPEVFSSHLQDSIIWYSRWCFGLLGYNIHTGNRYQIIIDSTELSRNSVFCITSDRSDNSLWVGTYGAGMIHIQGATDRTPKLTRYIKTSQGNSINQNEVLTIHDDGNSSLWLSTSGSGVNRFDKKTHRFESLRTADGLYSDVVESINSDANGDIWMATGVLSKFNKKTRTFTNYSAADGVIDEFNVAVTQRSPDGQMYFGGNGIVSFYPDSILPGRVPERPVLTGLSVFGQEVRTGDTVHGEVLLPYSLTVSDTLMLPYWAHQFAIEFASLRFKFAKNISYSYMLEGFDRDWIPASSTSRGATYTGLQPGKYTFMVKAANDRGEWSEVRRMQLVVIPAWWSTLLFKIAVSLAIAMLIAGYFWQRVLQLHQRNNHLEKVIALRTGELKIANDSLLKQADALNTQNESLRENQLFIELKNTELLETLQLKDKLMGIIGHDFKNSLASLHNSAVLLNTPEILAKPEKTKNYASFVLSSVQSIMQQMLMVFDWATGQMDQLLCNPVEINAEVLVEDAISLVRVSAAEKKIEMTVQYEFQTNLYVDPRMISTVLRNILTNAIKFTPIGGKVHVMVQEYDTAIDITVIDTGIGMSDSKQESIFTKLERENISVGTLGEKGTGLGLMICRSFVMKNAGSIGVKSTQGQGSVFTVTLPKGESAAVRKKTAEQIHEPLANIGISGHYVAVIIDDNPQMLDTLQEVFSPNFTVIKARDGQEGLYLSRNMMPDIIISDINMPGMSGMELCKLFKTDPLTSHIPFILITGENITDIENEAYLSGANDVIKKPFNPYILRQKLRALLLGRDSWQQVRGTSQPAPVFAMPDDFENKMISKVVALVQDRMADPTFDINTVADHVSMSRTQLWRIFKNTTGKSLGDYIKDMRMQKASDMLRTGRYRISEVAYEVGFSDPKYFAKCFQKEFGMSPSAFADSHSKKS